MGRRHSTARAPSPNQVNQTLRRLTRRSRNNAYTQVNGQHALRRSGYQIEDLGPVDVVLEFVDDGLQGYTVIVRRAQEAKLRAATPHILKAASSAPHRLDACLAGFFCLEVGAGAK